MGPPYFDRLIAAYRAGAAGRDVHLGYWDDPGDTGDFPAAQARLTGRIVDLLPLMPGQDVLDVACGFGGTLAALNDTTASSVLTGVNVDVRQLDICRSIRSRAGNRIALVGADACALPFPDRAFDHAVCVEAMFHFPSRACFLMEAARVLRPGGMLVVTDILLRAPETAPWTGLDGVLLRDYGPWPDLWTDAATIIAEAAASGLELSEDQDWTAATLPSYGVISPDPHPERNPFPDAGAVMRWMHHHGWLSYRMLGFRRPLP